MDLTNFTFYFFATLCIGSAGYIVFTKNIIHAAFALMATFLSISAIYVFAGADFIAIAQIMVYVGGILILIVFGVMLTNKLSGKAVTTGSSNYFFGFLSGFGLFVVLARTVLSVDFYTIPWLSNNSEYVRPRSWSHSLGMGLMSNYLLIFEIVAILLLVALIGAVVIGSKREVVKK